MIKNLYHIFPAHILYNKTCPVSVQASNDSQQEMNNSDYHQYLHLTHPSSAWLLILSDPSSEFHSQPHCIVGSRAGVNTWLRDRPREVIKKRLIQSSVESEWVVRGRRELLSSWSGLQCCIWPLRTSAGDSMSNVLSQAHASSFGRCLTRWLPFRSRQRGSDPSALQCTLVFCPLVYFLYAISHKCAYIHRQCMTFKLWKCLNNAKRWLLCHFTNLIYFLIVLVRYDKLVKSPQTKCSIVSVHT